jgi:serine/threonine protein kinase
MKLEIEILQKINHPNLIKLLEIYEGEQAFYLLNPYLMGETLNQYQKKSLKLRKFTIQRIMKVYNP